MGTAVWSHIFPSFHHFTLNNFSERKEKEKEKEKKSKRGGKCGRRASELSLADLQCDYLLSQRCRRIITQSHSLPSLRSQTGLVACHTHLIHNPTFTASSTHHPQKHLLQIRSQCWKNLDKAKFCLRLRMRGNGRRDRSKAVRGPHAD